MTHLQTLAPIVLTKKEPSTLFKIITSPKTTLALAATLAGLIGFPGAAAGLLRAAPGVAARGAVRLIPRTPRGALTALITIPTAVGILSQSKKARQLVKSALDPREAVKRGRKIGEIIEEPGKAADVLGIGKEKTLKEKIIAGTKAAGIAGGVIAAGLGAAALAKKGLPFVQTKLAERKARIEAEKLLRAKSSTAALGFTEPRPVGLGGVPIGQPQIRPLGAPGATQARPPIQNIIQIQVQ